MSVFWEVFLSCYIYITSRKPRLAKVGLGIENMSSCKVFNPTKTCQKETGPSVQTTNGMSFIWKRPHTHKRKVVSFNFPFLGGRTVRYLDIIHVILDAWYLSSFHSLPASAMGATTAWGTQGRPAMCDVGWDWNGVMLQDQCIQLLNVI